MDLEFKEKFVELWQKYFDGAELPITFYYTDEEGRGEWVTAPEGHQCRLSRRIRLDGVIVEGWADGGAGGLVFAPGCLGSAEGP